MNESLLVVVDRSGSVKRVAAAVGEGATAISQVHQYVSHSLRQT
jgi:microcompartment protein CcmL/EutN